MTPERELRQLQVRLPEAALEGFKEYAQAQGKSMASLMLSWIEGALDGDAPAAKGVVDVSWLEEQVAELRVEVAALKGVGSNASSGVSSGQAEVLAEIVRALQVQGEAQVKALAAQTQLLERLTQQERQATPYGGTERIPVVLTASEDARPVVTTKFTGFEDHSGTHPASGGEERRGATDEDLVVGARVWIKPWGCWGEVLEEPAGERGPAYVKAVGSSRMPGHFSAGQLEVLDPSEPQEDGGVTGQAVAA